MSLALDMAAVTDRGRVRPHNEDSLAARAPLGLAIVADGMGGHAAGEVASRMAVDLIAAGMEQAITQRQDPLYPPAAERLIERLIGLANAEIYGAGCARSEYAGMGTTVVVALWSDDAVSVGHVGDSRFYRLRAGRLEQLTEDHSLAREQGARGKTRGAPGRHILTRAVGSAPDVQADVRTWDTAAEDVYLLCSDGLTEMLPDERIGDVLAALGPDLQAGAEALVQQANACGGVDNVSVVIVRAKRGGGGSAP